MAKRKLYGLCKTCKDRVKCCKRIKDKEHPLLGIEEPPCDARNKEIHQKFFNWTDEYGNTEMYKLDLTKEEKIELKYWLEKAECNSGNTFEIYRQNISHFQYRHDKSEHIFKTTGVRTPTPDDFTIEEREIWYAYQFTQKGVCKDCIVRMCCSETCDAKVAEQMAAYYERDRIKNSGLCEMCVIRDNCRDEKNCIDREQEISKSEELIK
jgi:hypothetical protein